MYDFGAAALFKSGKTKLRFTNVPQAGALHSYLVFAAAYGPAGNLLGYAEAAVPEPSTTGGDADAPELTLHLKQGVFTNALAASPSLVPFQPRAGSSRIWPVWTLGGSGATGSADGNGAAAHLNFPEGVAVDAAGTVYVGDRDNHAIRQVSPDGVVRTLAGMPGLPYDFADGPAATARFAFPRGVAVDGSGNVYVADMWNHRIRKVSAGAVSTLAGSGVGGFLDGRGADAQFDRPFGVAVDGAGNVYVGDTHNHRIRKVRADGTVETLAGSGSQGILDGPGDQARFNRPRGVAVDGAGNVYVADQFNHRIRKVGADGTVTTLAGSGEAGFADGAGPDARFDEPSGVAVDGAGNVYVVESRNHSVRRVSQAGVVKTIAGDGTGGYVDATGAAARFADPTGVAVDRAGNLYVADMWNRRIRKIGDPPAAGGKLAPDDIGDAAVHHDYVVTKGGVASAFVWVPVFIAYQLINPAAAGHSDKPVGFWVKDKPSGTETVDWAKETFGGFYAGKYEASRADAQPGNPADSSGATPGSSSTLKVARYCVAWNWVEWGEAAAACRNLDPHAHLTRDDEWTALAVWSMIEGVTVYGNNAGLRDGLDNNVQFADDLTDGTVSRALTGTGARANWSEGKNLTTHTGTTAGVFDLNGNVSEWTETVGTAITSGNYLVNGLDTGVSVGPGAISALATDPRLRRYGVPGAAGGPLLLGDDRFWKNVSTGARAVRGGGCGGDGRNAGVWAISAEDVGGRNTEKGFRPVLRY